jgi:hypothetical protein
MEFVTSFSLTTDRAGKVGKRDGTFNTYRTASQKFNPTAVFEIQAISENIYFVALFTLPEMVKPFGQASEGGRALFAFGGLARDVTRPPRKSAPR